MKGLGVSLAEHFGALEDPRVEHLTDHKLLDIITIAICAIICGAETWKDMALFGQERLEWLREFIALENGVPSDDTFGRVFARLEPQQFQACFMSWVKAVFAVTKGQVIAVDGKSARHSYDRANGKEAVRSGQRLGDREPSGAGPTGGGGEVKRDYGHSGTIASAGCQWLHRHH